MSVIQVTTLIYNDIIKVQDLIDLVLARSRFIPNILQRIKFSFGLFQPIDKNSMNNKNDAMLISSLFFPLYSPLFSPLYILLIKHSF